MKKKIVGALSLVFGVMLCASLVACGEPKHTAKDDWERDATKHWHACSVEGHDDVLDEAEHTFGEWQTATAAGYGTAGSEKSTCSVCGYEKTRATAALDAKANTVALKEGVAASKTYDAQAIALSASDLTTNGDGAVTFEYKKKGSDDDFSATAPKDAGTYEVKASVAATAEWKACETTFDYTIEQYELTEVYGKTHTKEYDGDKNVVVRGITTPFGDNLNVQIPMKSANAGTTDFWLPGVNGPNNKNYKIDVNNITAGIVAKKLSGLELTVTEDELNKMPDGTNTIERTVKTGVIVNKVEEEVTVIIEFNRENLASEEGLEIYLTPVDTSSTCKISFKESNPNYEFVTGLIGELKLKRAA